MNRFLIGATLLSLAAAPAFAQSSTSQNNNAMSPQNQRGSASSNEPMATNGPNSLTVQKIKQDMQNAGFTDINVVAESFVVQAKSKDGDPILMTIGPHGMSVFEAMDNNNNSGPNSTTGSANRTTTPSSKK